MKARTRTQGAFRSILAVLLACGLMLPTAALATEEQNASAEAEALTTLAPEADAVEDVTDDIAATETNDARKASAIAQADASNFGITVSGGTEGVDYAFEKVAYVRTSRNGANTVSNNLQKLVILSDKPLTLSSTDSTVSANATIWVNPGVQANLTFNNLSIASDIPCHIERNRDESGATIEPKTSLRITLAAGSKNVLDATDEQRSPGIHCGEGTILIIDDDIPNQDTAGNEIVMDTENYPGKIPAGVSFVANDGKTYTAGTTPGDDRLSLLESTNPGSLTVTGSKNVSGIGSVEFETTGDMYFNGGQLAVTARGAGDGTNGRGAAIGGGSAGCGGNMYFNGGSIETWTSYHGASIGGGAWAHNTQSNESYAYQFQDTLDNGLVNSAKGSPDSVAAESKTWAGNIYINGGYIVPHGDAHGNAIGQGCCSWNKDHIIVIAGGTILPDTSKAEAKKGNPRFDCASMGIGAQDGAVCVIGGSVRIGKVEGRSDELFQAFINGADSYNSAFGVYPVDTSLTNNPAVSMIAIDLGAEVIKKDESGNPITKGDNPIIDWKLTVGNVAYEYGAPAQFTDGKLYLWLPAEATAQQISVTLSYLDENNKVQQVNPLFANPGQGTTLKRYIDFPLPDAYTNSLKKYYDGTPLASYDLSKKENWITTKEEIPKVISDPDSLTFKYQRYTSKENGEPIGAEVASGADGSPLTSMPADVGIMQFTMISTQYSASKDPLYADFANSYWGHRATGWCEILPIDSAIDLVEASWDDGQDGSIHEPAHEQLTVHATIKAAELDPAGNKTAETCQAPRGYIQLYVDKKPVGEPVKMVFEGDKAEDGSIIAAGSPLINAHVVPNGKGSYTSFDYVFIPAEKDFLVPDATTDGKHEVSVQFLPPTANDTTMVGNYLASVNPAEDPDAKNAVVAIEPIDPKASVDMESPNDTDSITSNPATSDGADGKLIKGIITATYAKHDPDAPNPNRLELKLHTPSSGPITVTTADGRIIEATMVVDEDGNPIRDENGDITIYVDPEAVGKTTLTIKQEPNGAYVSTTFEYKVIVKADPGIAPKPSITKQAKNLTHPQGPTQPGDRISYTISASNAAAGSALNSVVITDELPAALVLDETSVKLSNPADDFTGKLEKAEADPVVGQYTLSDEAANGKRTLAAPAGAVYGEATAGLTFECTVKDGITGRDLELADLGNVAQAEGTRDNPEDPDGPQVPVDPVTTDPVYPEGSHHVVPKDPAAEELVVEITVENATNPDAPLTHVGDILHTTITAKNIGDPESCVGGVTVTNPLPTGIEPVPGTIKITTPDGRMIPVPDSAYDPTTRTISVGGGDLWGGEEIILEFDTTIGPEAVGTTPENVGEIHGTIPSTDPDFELKEVDPGKPVTPPTDEPILITDPTDIPRIIGDDPADGDITLTKTAANVTRNDGTTRVGDTIRYTIELENTHLGTAWMDAVIRDNIPVGLEPLSNTIKLTLPDGSTVSVKDDAYDVDTRILSVVVGEVIGTQKVVLVFDALVTEEALDANIGNVVVGIGVLPSTWDPEAEHPAIGDPFTPEQGWTAYEKDEAHQSVTSGTAYAPGTDENGGVLPADNAANHDPDGSDNNTGGANTGTSGDDVTGGANRGADIDDSRTIKKLRLAKTGDPLFALAGGLGLAALGAGALLLRARRRLS